MFFGSILIRFGPLLIRSGNTRLDFLQSPVCSALIGRYTQRSWGAEKDCELVREASHYLYTFIPVSEIIRSLKS
jgi:hypothetical protein